MYFTSFGEKYCCNLDWLQYSVLTDTPDPDILCPEGLRIECCQGNNIFQFRAIVYDGRGAKYMTLLWHPYSSVLPPCLMTVQVANEFLYMQGMGVLWSFQDLQQIVSCTFNAIGRFDVCLDFESNEYRTHFLGNLNSNHTYVQRKSEGSVWWHSISSDFGEKKQFHCLSWGSKSSEIKVKIYHKSREQGMLQEPHEAAKPWIINEWRLNNMDVSNVWRLEFSFNGAGQLRYKGEVLTLERLADESWLLGVLLECYHNRFVCRLNQGRRIGHHNDDKRVYLLRLPLSADKLSWASSSGKNNEVPASITLLRSLMRQIDNPAILCHRPTFETYAATIMQVINDHRLSGYFLRTWQSTPSDYFSSLSHEVGVGLHRSVLSPSRLAD